MGILGIIGKIIIFPFKLIFGGGKKKESPTETKLSNYPQSYTPNQPTAYPIDVSDNLKAKVDLMMSQIDSMKIEYDAINQRIQNIERMVKEIYVMAKS